VFAKKGELASRANTGRMLARKGQGPSTGKGLVLVQQGGSWLCNRKQEVYYRRESEEVASKANNGGWCRSRRFTLRQTLVLARGGGSAEVKFR
jgi:hypothetical protein